VIQSRPQLEIEGATLDQLKTMSREDQDALLAFGRPISFDMGSATILAEFNRDGGELIVNLAHIDGGGEGVLAPLWKLIQAYAAERNYAAIRWNVHALTCALPNAKLQLFLRRSGFEEVTDPQFGRILMRRQLLQDRP
jgi:hypothetical protein